MDCTWLYVQLPGGAGQQGTRGGAQFDIISAGVQAAPAVCGGGALHRRTPSGLKLPGAVASRSSQRAVEVHNCSFAVSCLLAPSCRPAARQPKQPPGARQPGCSALCVAALRPLSRRPLSSALPPLQAGAGQPLTKRWPIPSCTGPACSYGHHSDGPSLPPALPSSLHREAAPSTHSSRCPQCRAAGRWRRRRTWQPAAPAAALWRSGPAAAATHQAGRDGRW
jgi:hypothetical protein